MDFIYILNTNSCRRAVCQPLSVLCASMQSISICSFLKLYSATPPCSVKINSKTFCSNPRQKKRGKKEINQKNPHYDPNFIPVATPRNHKMFLVTDAISTISKHRWQMKRKLLCANNTLQNLLHIYLFNHVTKTEGGGKYGNWGTM